MHRPRLEADLAEGLAEPGPAAVLLEGRPGAGSSTLLRTGLRDLATRAPRARIVAFAPPRAAPPRQRRFFRDALIRAGVGPVEADASSTPEWTELFATLLEDLDRSRNRCVVAVDPVAHLLDGGFLQGLSTLWTGARARGLPLHLVLAGLGPDGGGFLTSEGGALAHAPIRILTVGDLSSAEVREHLAVWSPRDRILLQACLGRSASTLGRVDPEVRLATNLQRLVLDPDGPLHAAPPRELERRVQKPDRYAGIVAALADGHRGWGELTSANPAFSSGNQLAPYLATLQDLGWVGAERSLDAAARSRRRRYRLTDPFLSFWYGTVEPTLGRLLAGESPARIARDWDLDRVAAEALPAACREALETRGEEVLPAGAREMGALWGDGYDFPVAGTLRTGAAVYGRCVWGRPATEADADAAWEQMRATRYGFGREARLRVIFTGGGATEALVRRAARDDLLTLVFVDDLF